MRAYDVTYVNRAIAVRETAVRVVKRMRVDRTVSVEEVEHLAGAVRELAEIVTDLARRTPA